MEITQKQMRDIIEGSSMIAQIVMNYYLELKKCGMGDAQATELAKGYQHTLLTMNTGETD